MSVGRTKRNGLRLVAALLVGTCCLVAFAANQTASRLEPHASVGITLQTVTWGPPDPGFAWEAVTDADIKYSWDWTPVTEWPEVGSPPTSNYYKILGGDIDDGYDETAYVDSYAVSDTNQSDYTATVEINVIIKDVSTGSQYVCYGVSTIFTDAYNNLIDHNIDSADWIIYPN